MRTFGFVHIYNFIQYLLGWFCDILLLRYNTNKNKIYILLSWWQKVKYQTFIQRKLNLMLKLQQK